MANISDRVLLLIIASTALGSLIMWAWGFVEVEMEGTRNLVFGGLLTVLFLATLVLVWQSSREMDQ